MIGKFLVVEDRPLLRQELIGILEGAGFRCDCAENGLDALRFALRNAYSLIVTDIEMPRMDGLKFVGRVRVSGPNTQTPVLVVSAVNEFETVQQAAGLGIQGYLLKPYVPEDVLAKVAEITGMPVLS